MASKKKQHYVPRFYLRNFSWDTQKAINIYNKKSDKLIPNGNLYNQCYEPYFYGEDPTIEDAFSDLEGVASRIIREMLNGISIPKEKSSDHHALVTHSLLQHARTKHATDSHNELFAKLLINIVGKEHSIPADYLDMVKITFNNTTSLALKTAAQAVPLAMDLRFKVLHNTTSNQFITSDNPVVLYNSCYENSNFGSHTGLAAKGLQIFFPLSPQYLLVFYDGKTYKVGERKKVVINISDVKDVRQLNDLQWLNCLENLYFHRNFPQAELARLKQKNTTRNPTDKAVLNEYPQGENPDGTSSSILHMHRPDHKIGLKLQCIRKLWLPDDSELNEISKSVRDPTLIRLHKEFIKLVETGKYEASDFSIFIDDKIKQFSNESPHSTIFDMPST